MDDIISWLADRAGKISAIGGLCFVTYRSIVKPVYAWMRDTADILSKLETIVAELSPNHGSSLRDAIDRIEMRLVVTEQRNRALLLDVPYGVWETDAQGELIWANRTYQKLLGRSFEEAQGNGWITSIRQEDREYIVEEWEKAVADARAFDMEIYYQTPERTLTLCHVKAYPLLNKKGEVEGWIGTSLPILAN